MHRFTKLLALMCVLALGPCRAGNVRAASEEEEKAQTIAQMSKVWEALMAFKKDRGQYPDYLSDLVPRYISDPDALVSPTEKRPGRHGDNGQTDPKFRTSFCYEFSAQKFNKSSRTFREIKEQQMEEFGQVVPLVRCFLYGRVLNMACSGDIFESPLYWETSPAAKEIMDRIGLGPGFKNGEFTALKVMDSEKHTPLAGAEVRVTERNYRGLPLPDRTVRAGADGIAKVPLGAPTSDARKLTVTVLKPGYFALPQTWKEDTLKKDVTMELDPGAVIGGIVKTPDGKPLAGAEVTVLHLKPDEKQESKFTETLLSVETTDADGRWKCERVPAHFTGIAAQVKHPSAWTTWFYSSNMAGPHRMLRRDLLADSAELFVDPAATIRGTVLDATGKPVADAEVVVKPSYPHAPHTRIKGASSIATRIPLNPKPVKTDAGGRYTLPWRDEALLTIMVFPHEGAASRTKTEASADMKAEDFRIEKGRSIKGHVTSDDGKPLAGAEVILNMWGDFGMSVKQSVARTDESGDFVWNGANGESMTFSIRADGFVSASRTVAEGKEGESKTTVLRKLR
ncbi:MAG: carboxypeptidase-like regulatory domain-containing protein [Chthoniobacteraceae bacterium]